MNRKQLIVIGALSVAAAFVGGVFGARLFAPGKAQAQGLPSYAEVITVGSLLLVDDAGNLKGGLAVIEGNPYLFLGDEDKQYMEIGFDGKSVYLFLRDTGKYQIQLSAGDGDAAVRTADGMGNIRAALGIFGDTPGIGFFDASGNFIWGAP